MKLLILIKKIIKLCLDFLFGVDSEVRWNIKKQKFTEHRKYRFVPRLRAKPQEKIY